jgi:hypothetical protein
MRGYDGLISVLRHDDGIYKGWSRCRMLDGCLRFRQCRLWVAMMPRIIYTDANFVAAAVPGQRAGKGGAERAGREFGERKCGLVWDHSQASC